MAYGKTLEYNAIILMEIRTGHTLNNTHNYVCKELDGLIASPWTQNGSSWVNNTQFRELVTSDLTHIVDRMIEIESYGIGFYGTSGFEIGSYHACISYSIGIYYNQDSDRNQQFKNYFLLYSMMERLWYVESIIHVIRASPVDSSWQFSTLIFAFVILLVFKSFRRKVKHSNNDKYVVRRKKL